MATETVNVDATALRTYADQAEADAIAAASTDATTKANAAQAAAISAAATDATTKANAAQAFAIQRSNHTGSQLASTISDFAATVRATVLTGLSLASSAAVAATDTVLEAFGKLQAFNGLFTTAGLAFGRLANPSAVRYPRINADNTVTALTVAQLYTDLAATGFAARTGSALAFDVNATYNSPTSPGSASVTLDTSGAVAGVEVVGYFNHSTEPTWPAGITAVGTWYNSGLNVVRFVYIDASNISAVISNERPVSEWRIVRKTSPTTRNSTSTLAADDVLVVPIAANQTVIIRGVIYITSAATPDFKYRITGPATPSEVRIDTINRAATGVTGPANLFTDAYHSADQVWGMTGTQSGSINIYISLVNGANSGNVAFEWAQNTSDAGNTTVRQNSWLEYQYGA